MMTQSQKLRFYCDLSEQTSSDIVAKRGSWMNFLDSAANTYKYSFAEQLLIHAQRPNATACAPIEMWNKFFARRVIPGTKGIALIDDSGSRPRLKYVFDVNDTHTYDEDAPQVGLWELREEHKPLVLSELAKIYDDVDNDSIAQTFHNIASQMAAEYYEDNTTELRYRAEGSFLEELDGDNLRAAFVNSVSTSMAYLIMKRCWFDTEEYFTEDDFDHISSFNTPDIIHTLGESTSDLSQQVLRDVEIVVKKYERLRANEIQLAQEQGQNINKERNVENERDNDSIPVPAAERDNSRGLRSGVRPSGGLSSAEHTADGTPGREPAGQVRNDEEKLLEEPPQDNLRADAVQGEPVPPLPRNRGTGGIEADPSAKRDTGESGLAGQIARPDGLGGGDEHNQSTGRGIGAARTDLRRDLADSESSSQLGTRQAGEAQPPPITEDLAQTLSTSSITADEVDSILRDGGNDWKNSVQRITAHYAKDLPLQDNADYLRDEYLRGRYKYQRITEGGKGFQFSNGKTSVWWNEDGIKVGRGESALFARDFALITWEQAAKRIGQLYDAGHYVNHDVLDEALQNEYHEVAESLLNIYRDDFRDIEEIEMPEKWEYFSGGWPDTVERITALLKDKGENGVSGEYGAMLDKLRVDIATFESFEGSLYRQWHDPLLTLQELEKLVLEPQGFPVANIQNLNAMLFITNDDIDSYLCRGSNVTEGKMRIFSHFLHEHTSKERIDFLKNEYGHGGGTWIDGWSNAEPGKGITLQRPGCEDVNMKWPAVAKRIGELVQSGRYMLNVNLDRLHSYEMIILSRQVKRFFETLPEDERHQAPFGIALDFHYPKQDEHDAMRAFLEDNVEIDACLEKMAFFVANTPEDDRYYNTRELVFRNLTAYRNDGYSLFPGAEQLPGAENAIMPSVIEKTAQPTVSGRGSRKEPDSLQLNLFETSPFPELPSAVEQQAIIERGDTQAELSAPDVSVEEAEVAAPELADEEPEETTQTAEPPQVEPAYKIGDIFQIDGKPWQIEKLDGGEWVHLKNLGTPSTFAVFDHTAVQKSSFDELLQSGKIHAIEQVPSTENTGGSLVSGEDTPPAEKLSPQLQAIADTTHKIPPDRASDIILYQIDDAYEAYGAHADMLAGHLPIVLIDDDYDPALNYVSFPVDKLTEYADQFHKNSTWNFTISTPLTDGTRDISHITHPFWDMSEWEQYVHTVSKNDKGSYTEPFVVIQGSENPNFADYEWLTFTDADQKFKETEAAERELRAADGKTGGYHKTNGVIFYKNAPDDTTLSTYEFRYDIGDYSVDRSGLYNHISNFWAAAQERVNNGEHTGFTQEEIDGIRGSLLPLLAQHQHLAQAPQEQSQEQQPSTEAPPNFRITDDNLGAGGAKTKYRANIDAITALQAIETEKRHATPEEMETMSRYVGWGGIAEAFNDQNTSWRNEYAELRALLTSEEYESAKGSVLNAHYTSPTVIRAIYDKLERLGFKTGNLLEPAVGVGNFFGMLPDSMTDAKLYGVELDSISARISKQLYPSATIKEMGYEKTDYPDSFFDVAVGNVPFGGYGVHDKRYDKHKFMIHDYFFGKTLDQVRPGGIIAFVTSKGTLDKQNPDVRKYLAQRAELLGAVRLPNTAFKANAGTEVTSDIIFLLKRDRMIDIDPDDPKFDWIHLGQTENGIAVNRYFVNNPEMMLGTMANDSGMRMYGNESSTTCVPFEGKDLGQQLKFALANVTGQITVPELDDLDGQSLDAIPADPTVRNFSFTVVDDRVYFRENSMMYPVEQPATTLERIKGMIGLRDCVRQLIDLQVDEHSEDEIKAKQAELNTLYDAFAKEYGLINASANNRAFATGQFSDNAYYLLCSLEILDEDGKLEHKGDMFTKRTIKQKVVVTHVDTATEALAVSMGEKACVDMAYMSQLTGEDEETLFAQLQGIIYKDIAAFPDGKYTYRTADEFLSGNIRDKIGHYDRGLEHTPESHPNYATIIDNLGALGKAMPKALEAHEINLRLGSTWISPDYVQQFMYELLKTSWHNQSIYQVKYHTPTGEWQVSGKGRAQYSDVHATVTYGTKRMNAYEILSDTLNLKDARVYDYKSDADGKQTRELNKKETMLAQQKQEQIKQAFKEWVFRDPDRREKLVKLYNEKFNSTRPREYDGSHITFSGISPEIKLRPHQLNAIAHILYGGNTLLAHEVGAGKTFEIVAAAMESKRLGLANKNLIAVPNHLTEQWASEWLRLYPSANILVATKKDFEMRNRKKFIAKIATGDYDAVIIGHTQLEKIPLSAERQQRILREQIGEIEDGIREVEASKGDRFTVKQLTKTKKALEARLSKLMSGKKRDDVIDFEQLGVDRLYIDESHFFKNLALYSKMRNVAGLNNSDAQKSSDLFMKTRYMDELTNERHGRPCGTIFASGTPISNSIAELYTVQRYLQYDLLMEKDLTHFDAWCSTFCEPQTSIELSPEGTGYRARTRLATFHNLPELMSMFKDVADIQTADMLDLPVPSAIFETIVAEPSEMQKEMVQELSERATAVQRKMVDARVDNMLKITTDGRKIGLDQRLMNPLLEDFEGSKINAATDNILRIWEETANKRLTQLVFSDFSTPNKDGRFNIYDDIRTKLIERGIPENEIEFIHNADSESKKKELFAKVRQGKVRVLFGSTSKMGAGTNVQDRLIAIHDVDCPWRPADLQQRAGRIIRQGNNNEEVNIYRYATGQTFDSYLWQTVEAKQKFIAQIMTSKSPVRSCEDVDETALSYAEIKALCAGNPLIAEKMNLDIEVARLRMLKADYQSQHYRLEDDLLKHYPKLITGANERIAGLEKDIALYEKHNANTVDVQMLEGSASVTAKFVGMTIGNKTYDEKEPAAKALLDVCKMIKTTDMAPIGKYMGFEMSLQFDSFSKNFHLFLKGSITHKLELGTDAFGNITRINNALSGLPAKLTEAQDALVRIEGQKEAAQAELEKPFALAAELAEKELKLVEINTQLNIGEEDVVMESVDETAVSDNADGEPRPKLSGADFIENIGDYNAGKRTDFVTDIDSYNYDEAAV